MQRNNTNTQVSTCKCCGNTPTNSAVKIHRHQANIKQVSTCKCCITPPTGSAVKAQTTGHPAKLGKNPVASQAPARTEAPKQGTKALYAQPRSALRSTRAAWRPNFNTFPALKHMLNGRTEKTYVRPDQCSKFPNALHSSWAGLQARPTRASMHTAR